MAIPTPEELALLSNASLVFKLRDAATREGKLLEKEKLASLMGIPFEIPIEVDQLVVAYSSELYRRLMT